jgi:spermidine synthase
VGLGVGTVAAFGEPGDYFRFYEINPDVVGFCREYFSYVEDSKAQVEIVLGDARVQLEREAARGAMQGFDILAVDAFSSDAIPIHLITQESVDLYLQHLKPDGLLLFHITNRSIDLTPVVRGLADDFRLHAVRINSAKDDARAVSLASWAILTRDEKFLSQDAVRTAAQPWPNERPPLLWTDDFASLWQILKR